MTYKFKTQEMIALIRILSDTCREQREVLDRLKKTCHAEEPHIYLLQLRLAILEELWIKLQVKGFATQAEYKVKLAPYQEICFWMQYNGRLQRDHAGNMIQMMCDLIHQKLIV